MKHRFRNAVSLFLACVFMASCGAPMYGKKGVKPEYTFPVTSNETPYAGAVRLTWLRYSRPAVVG